MYSAATSLPGLNIVLDLVQIKTIGTRAAASKERGHPKAHRFTEDDFASGRAHQVFTQTQSGLELRSHLSVGHESRRLVPELEMLLGP